MSHASQLLMITSLVDYRDNIVVLSVCKDHKIETVSENCIFDANINRFQAFNGRHEKMEIEKKIPIATIHVNDIGSEIQGI